MSKTRDAKAASGRKRVMDFLTRAFKAKDADELEKIADELPAEFTDEGIEGDGPDTHIHVHIDGDNGVTSMAGDEDISGGGEGRASFTDQDIEAHIEQNASEHAAMQSQIDELKAQLSKLMGVEEEEHGMSIADEEMEEMIKDEAPEGLEEQAAKAKDSAYLYDSFREAVAGAEILVPGIKFPTYDRAASPGSTVKSICSLRRAALDQAYANPATRAIISDLLGGKTLNTKRMTCDGARALFRSAVSMRKSANKAPVTKDSALISTPAAPAAPKTPAELNKVLRARYTKQ